jgi:hypothetical protein
VSQDKKIDDIEELIPELDDKLEMMKKPLPRDLQGKVPNGIFYYLCHIEGQKQMLLIVIDIKDDNVVGLMSLDAKAVFRYLSNNRAKFEDKLPTGVV